MGNDQSIFKFLAKQGNGVDHLFVFVYKRYHHGGFVETEQVVGALQVLVRPEAEMPAKSCGAFYLMTDQEFNDVLKQRLRTVQLVLVDVYLRLHHTGGG